MLRNLHFERKQKESESEKTNISFLHSQILLFKSRQKWGLVYSLATAMGLFCLPGVLDVLGQQQTQVYDVIQKIAPLPFIALFLSIGTYVLNDLIDSDLDRVNGKKRPIPSGLVSKRQALEFVIIVNSSAVILSLVTSNILTMITIIPMLAIGILYSARKIALAEKFLVKNISISIFYMLCVLLGMTSSYTLSLAVDNPFAVLRAVASLGIMVFISSILNDLGDTFGDRKAGRRTIPIVIGKQNTIKLAIALAAGLSAMSWLAYGLSSSSGLITTILTSLFGVLVLTRIANLRKHVANDSNDEDDEEEDFVRSQHKRLVPLHFLLQLTIFGGALFA